MQSERPQHLGKRLLVAVVVGAFVSFGLGWLWLQIAGYNSYGYWLFLGIPVIHGLLSSILLDLHGRTSFGLHFLADLLGWLLASLLLMVIEAEGAVCLIMAFPLLIAVMLIGSGLARIITADFHRPQGPAAVSIGILIPVFLLLDSLNGMEPSVRTLSTEIVIDAPPQQIWPHLSTIDIPASDFWMFRAGVAHPVRVRTQEAKQGGGRECVLSTGIMKETITEWAPNKRLAFKILNTPPSMREWNPVGEVKASHLVGYYECLEGAFTLIPLGNGQTKVVGTSLFQHRFRPKAYWGLWTDYVVRNIHLSVLAEIKKRAEQRSKTNSLKS